MAAQVIFTADTTPSLADLDANTEACFGLLELFTYPSHGTAADGSPFAARTGSNTKLTVDSSFNLATTAAVLAGTTSATPGNDTTTWMAMSPVSLGLLHAPNNSSTGLELWRFFRGSSLIGSITQSGTTAVAYNTTSDRRLKRNIADASDAGGIIDAIQVRSFDWDGAPDEHVTHGFIAQELVDVAPQSVKVGDGGALGDGSDIWGVDPSKLVPLLVKEVQSLRARVAAIEAA